ncbi:MAG: CoA transferase [Acidimicrobiales bacterium]
MRTLRFDGGARIGLRGTSTSVFYAKHWVESIGLAVSESREADPNLQVVFEPGLTNADERSPETRDLDRSTAPTRIVLWDFHTGRAGSGLHAAAAAGVSWVIGHADGIPRSLPIDMPEKWCGLVGANLALACLLDHNLRGPRPPRVVNVSAADVLRSFADQNAGNHVEVEHGWRRNGSMAVEHGGIYPQGFFPCRDGHVAMVGRSRSDWRAIREVIGRPAWTDDPRFDDPFVLAGDSTEVDVLLADALSGFDRDELLERSLQEGATLAPVYFSHELEERGILRSDFMNNAGHAGLPFEIIPNKASGSGKTQVPSS